MVFWFLPYEPKNPSPPRNKSAAAMAINVFAMAERIMDDSVCDSTLSWKMYYYYYYY